MTRETAYTVTLLLTGMGCGFIVWYAAATVRAFLSALVVCLAGMVLFVLADQGGTGLVVIGQMVLWQIKADPALAFGALIGAAAAGTVARQFGRNAGRRS